MIVALSILPVFAATSPTSIPAEYASAEVGSIWSGVPPYAFTKAAAKAALPGAVLPGNQSPDEKIPSVFAAPTLSGNSPGELAPLDRKSHFGAHFSWIMALT